MTEARELIKTKLENVFRDVFDDDTLSLTDATTAADVEEWDSLMHISLVVAIEKEFSFRLNAAEVGKLENVGGMLTLIEEKTGSPSA